MQRRGQRLDSLAGESVRVPIVERGGHVVGAPDAEDGAVEHVGRGIGRVLLRDPAALDRARDAPAATGFRIGSSAASRGLAYRSSPVSE